MIGAAAIGHIVLVTSSWGSGEGSARSWAGLLLVLASCGAACVPAAPPDTREVAFEDLRRVIATMLHHAELYSEKLEAVPRHLDSCGESRPPVRQGRAADACGFASLTTPPIGMRVAWPTSGSTA